MKKEKAKEIKWDDIIHSKWFIPLISVFILIILFSLRLISDFDIGFHLRGGQWILENVSFHDKDVFTYTVNQNEYIALHWLYQVVIYLIYSITSYEGLTVFNSILVLISFLLVFRIMTLKKVPIPLSIFGLLLILLTIQIRFNFRPEIFTWVFTLLLLNILEQYFNNRKNYLYLMPIIMILWINLHGLFIIGIFIMLSYFITNYVNEKKIDRYYFKFFILSSLATLVNPYFLKGVTFPFYLQSRLQSSNVFKNAISELKSPFEITGSESTHFEPVFELTLFYIIAVASILLLIFTYKKRKLHEYLILAGFIYISFSAFRNIPLLVFYGVYIIVISLNDIYLSKKSKFKIKKKYERAIRFIPYFITIIILLFCLRIINNAYYTSDRRNIKFGIGLNNDTHPVKAAEYILNNKLSERILNHFNFGSWFIWKLPQPVLIDGRLEVMKEKFFIEYSQAFAKGGLTILIKKYKPKMIIFDYNTASGWNDQLKELPDWRLIYVDNNAAIYAQNDYARQLSEVTLNKLLSATTIDTNIADAEVWRILRTHAGSGFEFWLSGFYKKHEYPNDLLTMGVFAYRNDEIKIAIPLFLEFIKKTNANYPEVYFNLGTMFFKSENYEKALYCYERYLESEPENKIALQRVSKIKSLNFK